MTLVSINKQLTIIYVIPLNKSKISNLCQNM